MICKSGRSRTIVSLAGRFTREAAIRTRHLDPLHFLETPHTDVSLVAEHLAGMPTHHPDQR